MSTSKTVYQIKVTLSDSKPPIWRRVLVADGTTLLQLHTILQTVMGWADYHLHMFTINGQIYGDPEDDEYGDMGTKNESRFKLNQLVGREGFKFRYEYDFGDSWLHDLLVEKILSAEKNTHYPVCVVGKRACPPEDSGGVGGYEEILEARTNSKHPQHREYKEWIGENFDPEHFDLDEVNNVLRHPRSRNGADPVINGQDYSQPPKAGEEILAKIATWVGGLDEKQIALIESLAVRQDMSTFLSYLNEKRVVGTQSTGNLPLKAVGEICAQFVNPPVLDEKLGGRVYKLRSEDDVWQLFFLHMLANTGGLVTGGQARNWKVTPSGGAFLNTAAPLQLGFMLNVWWHYEDWRIAFPVSGLSGGLPRDFNKITLKCLLELPVDKLVSYGLFTDQLIQETRFAWSSPDQDASKMIRRSAIERMVILPLVGFGCIETEYGMEDIGGSKFSKLSKISLTPFGKDLLGVL
jgi:hypothetical protein